MKFTGNAEELNANILYGNKSSSEERIPLNDNISKYRIGHEVSLLIHGVRKKATVVGCVNVNSPKSWNRALIVQFSDNDKSIGWDLNEESDANQVVEHTLSDKPFWYVYGAGNGTVSSYDIEPWNEVQKIESLTLTRRTMSYKKNEINAELKHIGLKLGDLIYVAKDWTPDNAWTQNPKVEPRKVVGVLPIGFDQPNPIPVVSDYRGYSSRNPINKDSKIDPAEKVSGAKFTPLASGLYSKTVEFAPLKETKPVVAKTPAYRSDLKIGDEIVLVARGISGKITSVERDGFWMLVDGSYRKFVSSFSSIRSVNGLLTKGGKKELERAWNGTKPGDVITISNKQGRQDKVVSYISVDGYPRDALGKRIFNGISEVYAINGNPFLTVPPKPITHAVKAPQENPTIEDFWAESRKKEVSRYGNQVDTAVKASLDKHDDILNDERLQQILQEQVNKMRNQKTVLDAFHVNLGFNLKIGDRLKYASDREYEVMSIGETDITIRGQKDGGVWQVKPSDIQVKAITYVNGKPTLSEAKRQLDKSADKAHGKGRKEAISYHKLTSGTAIKEFLPKLAKYLGLSQLLPGDKITIPGFAELYLSWSDGRIVGIDDSGNIRWRHDIKEGEEPATSYYTVSAVNDKIVPSHVKLGSIPSSSALTESEIRNLADKFCTIPITNTNREFIVRLEEYLGVSFLRPGDRLTANGNNYYLSWSGAEVVCFNYSGTIIYRHTPTPGESCTPAFSLVSAVNGRPVPDVNGRLPVTVPNFAKGPTPYVNLKDMTTMFSPSVNTIGTMPTNATKESRLKKEATNAAYRVAATQSITLTKNALINILRSQGHSSEKISAMADLLDTEFGRAIISMSVGFGMTALSEEHHKLQRFAKECRVAGMTTLGNTIFETIVDAAVEAVQKETEETEEEAEENWKLEDMARESETSFPTTMSLQ